MVAILEMKQKLSRKERFFNWWSIEGKIELAVVIVVLVFLIAFWGHPLAEGIIFIAVGFWCLGKIYFHRDQWRFLSLGAILVFYQGVRALLDYTRL